MLRFPTLFPLFLAGMLSLLSLQSPSGQTHKATPKPSVQTNAASSVRLSRVGQTRQGIASWYGPGVYGRRTASGEVFNRQKLTAAHRSLPLGTRLAVTNLENGKSVEVRVNDRGPRARRRLIDLSYAAARAIGLVKMGTAHVEVTVLSLPRP